MRQKLQNELYLITLLTIPYSPPINELGRNTKTLLQESPQNS